mmetsp:Transcript_4408/g.6732  ORF Transcript_4408/g.6732 Transcript_4408/m.6732 type:complete len:262 (+) Transcript_4408:111-896(+)|eukprot:CAMPEP_0197242814 /NCGR_PEP_ID=MMETSP1429-20130617/8448_1 /TAXON_ID=49237 /ORGANISM="Chaetoceros  sp., Strain UNC1202" /LENGTH=261 /DNA_ID=CAMNT_0042702913 /DNA_START=41 /DNA_END=826 /DNA_ORIENTATION=+
MISDKKEPLTAGTVQFVGTGVNQIPPRMVRVVAPNDLPGNYSLEVQTKDGYVFTATSPVGGAKAGEVFVTPEPQGYPTEPLTETPRGRWRDGLCDCFNYGICHASIWCSLLCRECHLGQVMQRMRLNWCGQRTTGIITAFRTLATLAVCYALFDGNLAVFISTQEEGFYGSVNLVKDVVAVTFSCYTIYALCQTRKRVREEFSIPEQRCAGCEDCMCATFCACCTVGQIARHTGDYDKNPAICCNATGLGNHVPTAAPEAV